MLALAGRQDGSSAFCARASGPNNLSGIDRIELNGKEQPPLLAGLRCKAGNAPASAHIRPAEASQTMGQFYRQCRRHAEPALKAERGVVQSRPEQLGKADAGGGRGTTRLPAIHLAR